MAGQFYSYLNPKCDSGEFEEKGGCGVFAREPIKKGELICLWGGKIVAASELNPHMDLVRTFHEAFQIPNAESPRLLNSREEYVLRHRLMQEENDEYLEACERGNLVEITDALGDQLYILCGTLLRHGLQDKMEEVFLEIQRSNMSKLDSNGKPIFREDGKVIKSELYFKPDIRSILER